MFSSQLVCGHQGGVPLDLGPLHFLDGLVGSEGWLFFTNDVIGHPKLQRPSFNASDGGEYRPQEMEGRNASMSAKKRENWHTSKAKTPTLTPPSKTVQAPKQSQQHRQRGIPDRRQPPPNFLSKRLIAWAEQYSLHFSTGSCIPSTLSIPTLPHSEKRYVSSRVLAALRRVLPRSTLTRVTPPPQIPSCSSSL